MRTTTWFAAGGVLAIALFGRPVVAADPPQDFQAKATQAIQSFQPFWRPPERELRAVRVVIYPAGGGAKTDDARRRDDLCLWTASHLYHLVRNAGGYPVLPRPDDRPASQPFEDTPAYRAGRQLAVQIVTAPGSDAKVSFASASEASRRLAQGLTGSGFKLKDSAARNASPSPAVTVYLPESTDPRQAMIGGIPAHRAWAEQIYHGLAAFIASSRAGADSSAGDDDEADPPVVPFYPRHAPSTPVRRTRAAIWPEGNLPASKAKWFCDLYVKQAFSDRTNVYFAPVVSVEGSTVVVGGATSHTALLRTLETALRAAGATDVRSEMQLLPEQGRLVAEQWFGACVAPMAITFGAPAEGGPLHTQLLYGEPVFVLDRQDGFYLVQGGGDGYVGWVRENCITTMSREQFKTYCQRPVAVLIKDVAIASGRIVRGSRLRLAAAQDGSLRLVLPDGKDVGIDASGVRQIDDSAMCTARADAALDLLNVPYLFAGRSSVGLDCSGLVGTMSDQYGCVLPRDAAQQFVTGALVATRWFPEGMRPGDRIYFLNETGKIFHTGLSLGGNHFVHSSPPGVQINSFKEGDRLYREHWDAHFLGARRP
jgi:hypothetical protein